MNCKFKDCLLYVILGAVAFVMHSCIRAELPNVSVDITSITPAVEGEGVVKSTIQENGVTVYADFTKADLSCMHLQINVSEGATWEYVDVKFDTAYYPYEYQGVIYQVPVYDTTVTAHSGVVTDFTQIRYVKVTAEREGINKNDSATIKNFSKFGQIDPANGRLYKIWSIKVLPAGVPTYLGFDNWYKPANCQFEHPYEVVGQTDSYVWSSTNTSMSLMVTPETRIVYGAQPTEGYSGKALMLTSNYIYHVTQDKSKQTMAGCCFLGEFDGSDTDALTCTHVGLPFNKKPETLSFYYKYLPQALLDPNNGQDSCFVKAVLYRTSDDVSFLTGRTIRDNSFSAVVAYAELISPETVSDWTLKEIPFTYTQDVDDTDLADYRYNLAIYFASSANGFKFICGPDTKLYIDEMNIICKQ